MVHIFSSHDVICSHIWSVECKSKAVFNPMNPNFDAVVEWSEAGGWLSGKAESLTLDNWLSGVRMSAEVLETVGSSALVVVLRSEVPAGKDFTIAEQLEEVLRVGRVRSLN